jgi:hypothetical protein
LRTIDPSSKPVYLMIEFAPLEVAGNVLRRHWLAGFERDGARWYFADAKRPGHLAGPYPTAAAFVDEYASYRGRAVVAFSERASYERAMRRKPRGRKRNALPITPGPRDARPFLVPVALSSPRQLAVVVSGFGTRFGVWGIETAFTSCAGAPTSRWRRGTRAHRAIDAGGPRPRVI